MHDANAGGQHRMSHAQTNTSTAAAIATVRGVRYSYNVHDDVQCQAASCIILPLLLI
jgi:hypothetical protein